jgi:hypothetical protein
MNLRSDAEQGGVDRSAFAYLWTVDLCEMPT